MEKGMSPSRLLEDRFLDQKEKVSDRHNFCRSKQHDELGTEANLQQFKRQAITNLIRDLPGELVRLQITACDQTTRRKSYANLL
jgi:hypothetical protein